MCQLCNGASLDNVLVNQDLLIRTSGYAMTQVSDHRGGGWTYTIGLLERFGHPDLLTLDVDLALQAGLVNALAASVVEHGVLPGRAELRSDGLSTVLVHPNHLAEGRVAMWTKRHQRVPQTGEFLQVVLSSRHFCACHAPLRQMLDKPLVRTVGNEPSHRRRRKR